MHKWAASMFSPRCMGVVACLEYGSFLSSFPAFPWVLEYVSGEGRSSLENIPMGQGDAEVYFSGI